MQASEYIKALLLSILSVTWACSPTGKLSKNDVKTPDEQVESSPVFSKSFTGFALYDPEQREMLWAYQADKYFTPASNTKIFTLYAALEVLGDSMPMFRYKSREDTLILQGMGNPLFLHRDFAIGSQGLDFLKKWPGPVFFSEANFRDEHFGDGWAWDDYPYYYQAEKSPLPVYGNVVRVQRQTSRPGFRISPEYFYPLFTLDYDLPGDRLRFGREVQENCFTYNTVAAIGPAFERDIPFHYRPELVSGLLADTLRRAVLLWTEKVPAGSWRTLSVPTPDTLYRRLMQDSDNFIAEQLLLMIAAKRYGTMNTDAAIRYVRDSLLQELPDQLNWRDGSGLSRYNLFTPRTIVRLLEKLYLEQDREWLFGIFPAGGVSGTIKKWYKGEDKPYIFAKTGTLSNNHSLSGYLKARSGKLLIFSFMHNNYITNSEPLKVEMEKVLRWIRDNY